MKERANGQNARVDFQKDIIRELENKNFIKFVCDEVKSLGLAKADIEKLTPDELYGLIVRHGIYSKYVGLSTGVEMQMAECDESPASEHKDPYIDFTLPEISGLSAISNANARLALGIDFGYTRKRTPTFSTTDNTLTLNFKFCLSLDFLNLKITRQNTVNFLSNCQEKIKIFILQVADETETQSVVAFKCIDWRYVLAHGKVELSLSCEWSPAYKEHATKIKCKLVLALLPKSFRNNGLTAHTLETKIDKSTTDGIERAKLFYEYSKIFWKNLDAKGAKTENKNARIFFRDETGTYRPAFSYLMPLRLREVPTPSHALRFASLLSAATEGGKDPDLLVSLSFGLFESAKSPKFISFLLACLLIGFGMKAWVVCGLDAEGEHYWVLTQSQSGDVSHSRYWLPDKGEQIPIDDPKVHYLFRGIGCLVGMDEMLFNVQENVAVA